MVLEKEFKRLEAYFPEREKKNESVSKAGVGWHLDHSLKVLHSILTAMEKSDPAKYKSGIKPLWQFFKLWGKFPRGKAKAPKFTLPPEQITLEALQKQLAEVKAKVAKIDQLPPKSYFKHPMFGHIKRNEAPRFMAMHTNHHLNIIRDILKA